MGLFTASMDATAIVWQPDADSGLWLERVRVGKVGGNLLGFFGGDLGADSSIIAHGWSGAFHLWKHDQGRDIKNIPHFVESDEWNPAVTLSGHLDEVMSVSWDPSQNYILSVRYVPLRYFTIQPPVARTKQQEFGQDGPRKKSRSRGMKLPGLKCTVMILCALASSMEFRIALFPVLRKRYLA